MKQKSLYLAVVAAFVMHMTGCASLSPGQSDKVQQPQQEVIDALKIAPRGSVELTVGYCNSQQGFSVRTHVVALGETAVFDPKDTTIYELKIRPFKTTDGKIVMSMTAEWQDKVERRDILFSRQILTQDGEMSPQSVLQINGQESCFTVTARSSSQAAR